jgi:hypothetical protein
LTLVRSGGYTKNNGLEDALFVFGRTFEEVKLMPKCRIPTGLVNLLRRNKMQNIALETGFFIEISSKKKQQRGWFKFEHIISVKPKSGYNCPPAALRGVFSVIDGFDTFELGIFPWSESMPNQLWIRVSELDDRTLAWILSQDKILCGDDNHQKTLHDFSDIELSNPKPAEYLRLPPPPERPYNFFDED